MARHAKPNSNGTAAVWGGSVLGLALLLLISVLSAVSFASPDHPFAPPREAKFFTAAMASAAVSHHPRVRLEAKAERLTVRVRPGDTLSRIAARYTNSASNWPAIWWRNRTKVHNPNAIYVGESLRLGTDHHAAAWIVRRAMRAIPKPPPPPAAPTVTRTHRRHVRSHTVAAAAAPVQSYSGGSGFEACVIAHESGGNPSAVNPTSGAGGLYQFLPSTWASLGYASSYPGGAQTAPVSVQRAAFQKLYAEAGTSPWAPYDGC